MLEMQSKHAHNRQSDSVRLLLHCPEQVILNRGSRGRDPARLSSSADCSKLDEKASPIVIIIIVRPAHPAAMLKSIKSGRPATHAKPSEAQPTEAGWSPQTLYASKCPPGRKLLLSDQCRGKR